MAAAALLINQLIGLVWYHPHPFEVGLGHTLLAHMPETSFPSDHATVFFSITLALLLRHGLKIWGAILIPFSLLLAWSRVWLGVHHPLDMPGALIIAITVILVFHRLLLAMSAWLNDIGETIFRRLFS